MSELWTAGALREKLSAGRRCGAESGDRSMQPMRTDRSLGGRVLAAGHARTGGEETLCPESRSATGRPMLEMRRVGTLRALLSVAGDGVRWCETGW